MLSGVAEMAKESNHTEVNLVGREWGGGCDGRRRGRRRKKRRIITHDRRIPEQGNARRSTLVDGWR